MSLETELLTIKEQVARIMEAHPITRNSDDFLTLYYLKEVCHWPISFVEPQKVMETHTTSVRRLRQVIQNDEHRLLPTDPQVMENRRAKAEKYRRAIKQV